MYKKADEKRYIQKERQDRKKNRRDYYQAECLKQRHTLGKNLPWITAAAAAGTACVMNGSYAVISGYNWWYAFFLPGLLILCCFLVIRRDQKSANRTILLLPLDFGKVWDAKVMVCAKNLLIADGVLFVILLGEEMFLTYVQEVKLPLAFEPQREAAAVLILGITFLWQIPLFLWMSQKAGMAVSLVAGMALNCLGTIELSLGEMWFLSPFAIPARLMCPVLRVLPNGLTAQEGNVTFSRELLDERVVLPGIALCLLWFFLFWALGRHWFRKQCEAGGKRS